MLNQPYALITGAANRIGRELALTLAKEKYNIILHYNKSKKQALQTCDKIKKLGCKCQLIDFDFEVVDGINKLASDIFKRWDCRLIIHNASYFKYDLPPNINHQHINKTLNINLVSPLLLNAKFYEFLNKSKTKGQIIYLLDAKLGSLNPDFFSYTLSKSVSNTSLLLEAMTYAPLLRVNGIAPGLTMISGKQTQASFQKAKKYTALRQGMKVESLTKTLKFLINNDNITAQTIIVDDGLNLYKLPRDLAFMKNENKK